MSAAAGQAAPGVAPTGPPNAPRLPGHLAAHPRLSQWIALGADGTATVTPGKVEIGQGIVTALASVVAGELALPPARVRMVPASTATSPNEAGPATATTEPAGTWAVNQPPIGAARASSSA